MGPVEHELAGSVVVVPGAVAVTVTVEAVGLPQRLAGVAAARTGRAAREIAAKRENIIVLIEELKESAEERRELLGVFDLKPEVLRSKLTPLLYAQEHSDGMPEARARLGHLV